MRKSSAYNRLTFWFMMLLFQNHLDNWLINAEMQVIVRQIDDNRPLEELLYDQWNDETNNHRKSNENRSIDDNNDDDDYYDYNDPWRNCSDTLIDPINNSTNGSRCNGTDTERLQFLPILGMLAVVLAKIVMIALKIAKICMAIAKLVMHIGLKILMVAAKFAFKVATWALKAGQFIGKHFNIIMDITSLTMDGVEMGVDHYYENKMKEQEAMMAAEYERELRLQQQIGSEQWAEEEAQKHASSMAPGEEEEPSDPIKASAAHRIVHRPPLSRSLYDRDEEEDGLPGWVATMIVVVLSTLIVLMPTLALVVTQKRTGRRRRYPVSSRSGRADTQKKTVSSKKSPMSSKKSPTASKKSPTASKKAPASSKKSPMSSKKSPTASKKSPTASKKAPASSKKSPTSSKKKSPEADGSIKPNEKSQNQQSAKATDEQAAE